MPENSINRSVFSMVFGHPRWTPAPWMSRSAGFARRRPLVFALILLALAAAVVAAIAGWHYYQTLPQPLRWAASVSVPEVNPIDDETSVPQPLVLNFAPQDGRKAGEPARLDLIDQQVYEGVALSPEIAGTWRWVDGRQLIFDPVSHWPADTRYTVKLGPQAFADGVLLAAEALQFTTPAFTAKLKSIEFHQDPARREERRVFATLEFSHAVKREGLEEAISLGMRASGAGRDAAQQAQAFSIALEKDARVLHLKSSPVMLPEKANVMKLAVGTTLRSRAAAARLNAPVTAEVRIPDRNSYFRVEESSLEMLRDRDDAPRQTLLIKMTDDISSQSLKQALSVYLLPKQKNSTRWSRPGRVTAAVLDRAQKLNLKPQQLPRETFNLHSYQLDLPAGREVYVQLRAGVASAHGFNLAAPYTQVLALPRYPREAKIRSEGALLARNGERRMSLMARGLPGLKVEIGRVHRDAINHLVSQTGGDLDDPYFQNYLFSEDDIVSWQEKIISLAPAHPRDPVFATLDLAPWLDQPLGLFFIRVKGWDPAKQRVVHGETDKRLVLVSDLGLLIKRQADDSDQLFVQSVRTGKPVANATVELLGRNGEPVFSGQTNAEGMLPVPDYSEARNARAPTVYVVRQADDLAFIPWQRSERRLGYSRFDVGGAYSRNLADDALNAYLFSDRGIYRPGESAHVGVVLRRNDLNYNRGIPLEIAVSDPKGSEVFSQRRRLPARGFLEFEFQTEAWSPTGEYQAQIFLVNSRGHRSRLLGSTGLKLEEFQPDKLRIESDYVAADDGAQEKLQPAGWINDSEIQARVALQNLFGTPAQDRRVTAELRLAPAEFRFDDFPGYVFSDPNRDDGESRASIEQDLTETRTNDAGIAHFDLDLARFDRGLWRVNFFARGFETGSGRGVSTARTALVSPATHLVGVKADGELDYIRRNSERRLQLVAVNNNLQKIALDGLRLRRSRRVQVSTLVQAANGSYSYQSLQQREPVDARDYSLPAAGGSVLLDTSEPGDFVLDVITADGQILASSQYTVAGASNLAARLERSVELDLVLDKKQYAAGESIELQITAPYTGAGLITIERDRVYAHQWFSSDSRRSVQSIRIPEGLEGNAYVNVSFLRAIDSPEVYASPLSYAVAPFKLERSQRKLQLSVDAPALARPGEPMQIKYRVDQPARIAVFAVDEGILQVANYNTPSPLDYFLQKRALEVDTQQILDLLLPEIRLLQSTAAAGGGEAAANYLGSHLNPFARRGYKPAVFWSGLSDVQPGSGQFEYTPPDSFNGSLRVMAVAVGESRMAAARDDSTVRAPFVISPSLPAAVAPGDEFQVAVGLSNVLDGAGRIPIELTLKAGEGLSLADAKPVTLELDEGSEGRALFRAQAGNKLGPASLRFVARGGDVSSQLSTDLSIRPAMPYMTTVQAGIAESGNATLFMQRELFPEHAERRATASNSPLALVDGLSAYLAEFPHFCTEQIISQVFPLLTFLDQPQFIQRYSQSAGVSIDAVIRDLRGRQLASGGFELWPGQGRPEAWASVHAMLFLMEAQSRGQSVPNTVLARGRQYLEDVAAKASRSMAAARVRAQAIYLLTRDGVQTTNDLVHLHEGLERDHTDQWRGDVVAAWMAASYVLLQQRAEGEALIEAYTTGRPEDSDYAQGLAEYDSILAQDAQYLWLLAQQFPDRMQRLEPAFLQRMLRPVFGAGFNTLSSAWTVLALGAYQTQIGPVSPGAVKFDALNAQGKSLPVTSAQRAFPQAILPAATRTLKLQGPEKLFYSLASTGYDSRIPEKPLSQGLEIDRSYLDSDGKPIATFKQGQEITVRLRVRSKTKAVSNGVIIDLLPGGFQVDTDSVSREFGAWRADYVDLREDRVLVYGRFDTRTREINYKVRATAAGRFALPPVYAESMYDRSMRARGPGGQIEISPAQ